MDILWMKYNFMVYNIKISFYVIFNDGLFLVMEICCCFWCALFWMVMLWVWSCELFCDEIFFFFNKIKEFDMRYKAWLKKFFVEILRKISFCCLGLEVIGFQGKFFCFL